MGWAKYDEDIRDAIDDNKRLKKGCSQKTARKKRKNKEINRLEPLNIVYNIKIGHIEYDNIYDKVEIYFFREPDILRQQWLRKKGWKYNKGKNCWTMRSASVNMDFAEKIITI